jgi:hypothetical protein
MRSLRLWSASVIAGLCAIRPDALVLAQTVARPSLELAGPAANAGGGAPAAERPSEGNPLWKIPLSALSATRERPLFSASRRPPPPATAPAPPPPPMAVGPVEPQKPPFSLIGTIIGQDQRIGIFLNEASQATTRIRLGQVDSGWTLRSLDPRSAILEGAGQMVTLELPQPGASGDPTEGLPPQAAGIVRRNLPRDNSGDGL